VFILGERRDGVCAVAAVGVRAAPAGRRVERRPDAGLDRGVQHSMPGGQVAAAQVAALGASGEGGAPAQSAPSVRAGPSTGSEQHRRLRAGTGAVLFGGGRDAVRAPAHPPGGGHAQLGTPLENLLLGPLPTISAHHPGQFFLLKLESIFSVLQS
jgi:hypothetical protein